METLPFAASFLSLSGGVLLFRELAAWGLQPWLALLIGFLPPLFALLFRKRGTLFPRIDGALPLLFGYGFFLFSLFLAAEAFRPSSRGVVVLSPLFFVLTLLCYFLSMLFYQGAFSGSHGNGAALRAGSLTAGLLLGCLFLPRFGTWMSAGALGALLLGWTILFLPRNRRVLLSLMIPLLFWFLILGVQRRHRLWQGEARMGEGREGRYWAVLKEGSLALWRNGRLLGTLTPQGLNPPLSVTRVEPIYEPLPSPLDGLLSSLEKSQEGRGKAWFPRRQRGGTPPPWPLFLWPLLLVLGGRFLRRRAGETFRVAALSGAFVALLFSGPELFKEVPFLVATFLSGAWAGSLRDGGKRGARRLFPLLLLGSTLLLGGTGWFLFRLLFFGLGLAGEIAQRESPKRLM